MASNRHLGRIVALQTLYEYDFRVNAGDESTDITNIMKRNIGRYRETVDDKDFVINLVQGVFGQSKELDEMIAPIAPEWPVEQIARIDKIILRMSLFELTQTKDVPHKVVINEAVELAKSFGGDNSSKFVNGVLGTAYRNIEDGTEGKPPDKKKAASEETATETKPLKKSSALSSAAKTSEDKPASDDKPAVKKTSAKKAAKKQAVKKKPAAKKKPAKKAAAKSAKKKAKS